MRGQPQGEAPSGAGRGLISIIAAAILAVGIGLLWNNLGAVIDGVGFYVSIPLVITILTAIGLVAAILWFQGHWAYGQSKGYAPMTGLVLGVLPIVGLFFLLIAPARRGPAQPSEATAEPDAQAD